MARAPYERARLSLQELVYEILRRVPQGRVVTYGQLALLAGYPRAARQVGWIAHAGARDLPWQRVVNRFGGLASGYRGGRKGHKLDLEDDGVRVRDDLTVDLARYQWWPDERPSHRLSLTLLARSARARSSADPARRQRTGAIRTSRRRSTGVA